MPTHPTVSIITPAYNASETIDYCIESIMSQSFSDWELIVIDDHSSDDTLKKIQEYATKDDRIRALHNPVNLKVARTRNRGISESTGKYIAFLDSDDSWHPEKLKCQVNEMEHGSLEITYCSYSRVDEAGSFMNTVIPPEKTNYNEMLLCNHIANSTSMYLKSAFKNLRYIETGHEDYVFWMMALKAGATAYRIQFNKPLVNYTVRKSSISGNKLRALSWQWNNYREHLKLPIAHALFCFTNYVLRSLRKRV